MEKIVLFLFLNVFSSLADVWCFFKISRVRSKKRQILFLCIANIFLGLLLSIGNIGDCKIVCVRMNDSLNLFL